MARRGRMGVPGRGAGAAYAMLAALLGVAGHFAFAAVQGEYGVFRRVELSAERDALAVELAGLDTEAARLRDRISRLSDGFIDLDLLDERARLVLGMARADEVLVE